MEMSEQNLNINTILPDTLDEKEATNETQAGEGLENNAEKIKEQMAFRFEQSSNSRLAEYITGLRPDDPRIFEKIVSDMEMLQAKYDLPSIAFLKNNPTEYERIMREKTERQGTRIRATAEIESYFKGSLAGAAYDDESNSIFVNVGHDTRLFNVDTLGLDEGDEDTINIEKEYRKRLLVLTHEYVHVMQRKNEPKMPIEVMEYEAYLTGLSIKHIESKPENIEEMLFGFYIRSSVNSHYNTENEKRPNDDKLKLVWDTPEFFLENIDGFSKKKIELYKKSPEAKNAKGEILKRAFKKYFD